ncbi:MULTISPECIES: dihydroxyacetone kinase subunit DhaL [unclassified Rhizobium]|jgi:dihydroxyacetone kinase-like protein|uniref:dihydroxyacetone kinase subunit DhaL n=1 Tax=unclassified Rhizobium TaxID=2613769 RepID=UPI00064743AA|nr:MULTISPECIES: dihydroxyacetone kinase subunit DhaL [unclassified Rhizobium]MBN8952867.1 dihydroxyacetone kinase subunit L [Rhizobium tropici]OJY76613.1 MAG: dihydroxyacetone kinase subunit L [Rhizobium sp. 60-20]RKD52591.1 dihydroxyacetone kinase DhaL subunit [Rhizobium sp. WW_1]
MTTITTQDLQALFVRIAEAIAREKDRLCELDGVIGDADHGIAMELGFAAAAKAVSELEPATADPTLVFNTAAKSFLNAVGASSGPLYATALMRAGAIAKGKSSLNDDDMVEIFSAFAKGIQDRGKAEIGEKTMVDAWAPAAAACRAARDQGSSLAESLATGLKAGEAGAEATKDMIATKGRSSRLGERALGHIDPGAASAVVVITCLRDHFMRYG